MTTQTEALKMALYALEAYRPVIVKRKGLTYAIGDKAITAIKEASAKLDKIAALQQKTESHDVDCLCSDCAALDDLDEALAQPEQEPVACPHCNDGRDVPDGETCNECGFTHLPYGSTTPPASKPWVGLTDEEYGSMYNTYLRKGGPIQNFTRAIEAKLKEKNT